MSDDFYDIMSHTSDRLRLKDKIVSNVAKAIKAIQQYYYSYGEAGLVLSNADWQCHKLCENLDHALLHGLRHITNGYWKVVTEYTRKGTVKEIQRFNKVTTDLGRGRAWLYLSLNECLLESYIRCLLENEKHIKKYYVKEALLLDQQRMHVLLTLTSGLDFVTFQLEPNVPYLDLGTSPPKPPSSVERCYSQDDRVSLHSMDSVSKYNSIETGVSTPDSYKVLTDSDTASLSSLDTTNGSTSTDKSRQYSLSFDSGCHLDNLGIRNRPTSVTPPTDTISNSSQGDSESRLKRIESITVMEDTEEISNVFEIIRVKSKHTKSNNSKKKKSSKVSTSQYSNLQSVPNLEENNNEETVHGCEPQHIHKAEVNVSIATKTNSQLEKDSTYIHSIEQVRVEDLITNHEILESKLEVKSIDLHTEVLSAELENLSPEQKTIAEDIKITPDLNYKNGNSTSQKTVITCESDNVQHVNDFESHMDSPQISAIESDPEIEENVYELYKNTTEDGSEIVASNSQQRKAALDDYVKFISGESSETVDVDTNGFGETDLLVNTVCCDIDYNVNIDNNTMLHVMLEVFQDEEEKFIKMMSCRQGQTEGNVVIVFVLITDRRVYLLHPKNGSKKFVIETSVAYQDIDFIVHSINYQIINIVCTNKRNQLWLTTGDEILSRLLVQTMCDTVDSSDLKIRRLAVFDDATTQKICLKKYIIQECHCEPAETIAEIYSLVYWEDPHSQPNKLESCSRQGKLFQKLEDSYRGFIWKPVYVILRDGILCIFNDKMDSKPESYLRMGGDQCVGCRRSQTNERQHCMEIVLANGENWLLSAADNADMCDWLMCMCRAVSEGIQEDGTPFSCLPCCSVVTDQKILMCHEDVQTSFFRTLGSANIEEVTGIIQDPEDTTYCVLEFDSLDDAISSEEWVLYFNSTNEKNKFCKALSTCWARQFQVDLPTNTFNNITLQKRCQETCKILRNSLLL